MSLFIYIRFETISGKTIEYIDHIEYIDNY